jgi:hypothetical protein
MLHRTVTVFLGAWLWAVPVYAQTSTERVRANLDAQYGLMKQVMNNTMRPWTERRQRSISLPCIGGDPAFHSKDRMVNAIGVLAGEMVQASRALRWAQYPPSVWEESLADIERRQLNRIRQLV